MDCIRFFFEAGWFLFDNQQLTDKRKLQLYNVNICFLYCFCHR